MGGLLLRITDRDADLLSTLSLRVRILSHEQIVRTWWQASTHSALPRLGRLMQRGLLRERATTAIRIGERLLPLTVWSPGEPMQEFGALAWALKKRWSSPTEPTTVYFVTAHGARLFGGVRIGRVPRAFHVSHDLGVAEMFLAIRRQRPHAAGLWIDEDRLAPFRRGEKLPDAILAAAPTAVPIIVLEWGGLYSKKRLLAFHRDCEGRGVSYEIW
jgi:hypothetical protein